MSEEAALIPVNVWLSGRSYRIRIPADQEAAIRRAVKAADEKITELRQHYAGKDDQDFVAMCLLMYATDLGGTPPPAQDSGAIAQLVAKIDKALKEQ